MTIHKTVRLNTNTRRLQRTTGGFGCTCGHRTAIIDARPTEHGFRRRRECPACGHRFTTHELQLGGVTDFASQVDILLQAAQSMAELANALQREAVKLKLVVELGAEIAH